MNALELAEKRWSDITWEEHQEIQNMLRQQHAEIEALKAEINDLLGKNYVLSESGE